MSSTARGGVRNVSDYYVTPPEEIDRFLTEMLKVEPNFLYGSILDPCAGGDATVGMSYPDVLQKRGITDITTMDIREDSLASIKGTYLAYKFNKKFDSIISNPPFALAEEFIRKALIDVKPNGGYVTYLLRLNFFGSKKRMPLWKEHMPTYCFVHPERMSFTGGGTDSIEYMHAVWITGHKPKYTELRIII